MGVFDYWLNAQQQRPQQQAPQQMPMQPRMMPQGMQQPASPMHPMMKQPLSSPQQMFSRQADNASLNAGANVAMNAIRHSVEPAQQPNILQTLGNVISDYGTAGLRASQTPIARELGRMQMSSQQKQEEQQRQLMMLAMLEQKEALMRHREAMDQKKMSHAEDVLGESRRHHNMMASERREARERLSSEERRQDREINAINEIQKVHPSAIPYTASMPSKERTDFTKDLQSRINEPLGFKKQLNIVDEMLDVVEKNPNISTSFGSLIEGKGVVSRWVTSEKNRVDLEKLNNLQKRLALTKVESGVGGARMTVFLEKLINESKVHGGLHPDTIKAYKKSMKGEYKHLLEDSKTAREALKGHRGIRYYVPRSEDVYQDLSDMSTEELMKAAGL